MNYEEAKEIIDKQGRRVRGGVGIVSTHNPTAKKLKNQTWLHYDKDGHYTLAYFNKQIIEFHPKYMVFNDHDYFSSSTMQRFNEYMPRGFHIRGCTYPAFKLQRPLGFITTPVGTYPYRMPCSYTYEGESFDHGGLYADARTVLMKIPKYVDVYLDELLKNKPCFIDDEETTQRAFQEQLVGRNFEEEKFRISRLIGTSIEQGRTYKHLAVLAAENSGTSLEGLRIEGIARAVADYGAVIFKTQTPAGQMESALRFAMKLPPIKEPQIRKTIRYLVIEHIINLLGFDVVQWNRRER